MNRTCSSSSPKAQDARAIAEMLAGELRKVVDDFPGDDIGFTQPIEMRVSEMLTGSRGDVAVKHLRPRPHDARRTRHRVSPTRVGKLRGARRWGRDRADRRGRAVRVSVAIDVRRWRLVAVFRYRRRTGRVARPARRPACRAGHRRAGAAHPGPGLAATPCCVQMPTASRASRSPQCRWRRAAV